MGQFYLIHPATDAEGVLTNAIVTPAAALPQVLAAANGVNYRVASLLYAAGTYTPWTPAALFASGEVGWVEPMIPGVTLFQDAAGTIPVTAPGQPVGLSKFTAGGQLGFRQTTALYRPIYQVDANGKGYLSHNGTNQWMVCDAFDWGSDKATICAGVRPGAAQSASVFETFVASTVQHTFSLKAELGGGGAHNAASTGSATFSEMRVSPYIPPITNVVTATFDKSGATAAAQQQLRVNGVLPTQTQINAGPAGAGNFGNLPIYAGARGGTSRFYNGARYPSAGINRLLTAPELANLEAWANSLAGAY